MSVSVNCVDRVNSSVSRRKHIALQPDQHETFKEAKLLMQQLEDDPDLDDNETVELLAKYYIENADPDQ